MSVTAAPASHRQVGFWEAIRLGYHNYVTFTGRSSRGAYWYWFIFMFVAGGVLDYVDEGLSMIAGHVPTEVGMGLAGLFTLISFLPGLALSVRRLHDIGRSGWWVLIVLIPLLGALLLIWWHAQPGERAENRFGPDVEAGRETSPPAAARA